MPEQPDISVVMPAFNAAQTIADSIESILQGTFQNFELLIVDDGSTDTTPQLINKLSDGRIRLVRQEHQGIVAALNFGVAQAKSPVIARMDADDLAHPDRLTLQFQRLSQGDVDVVGSQVRIVDGAGCLVESMDRYQRWINEHLGHESMAALRFVESPLVHPTVMARRQVFELGYRAGAFPEDYDLWLRAFAGGYRFAKIDRPLLDWVDGDDRLTRTDSAYTFDAFDRCRRTHLKAGPLAGVAQVDLWGAGKTGKPWMRWLLANGVAVRRLYDISPRKIGQKIHGVVVAHPDDMPRADGTLLLIAVGAAGARELIAPDILGRGFVSGRDAWFVA